MSLQAVTEGFLGPEANVRFVDWRGRRWGPENAPVTVHFNSVDAVKHFVRAPNELGLGRAYVSGAMDIEGDIWTLLRMGRNLGGIRFSSDQLRALLKEVGVSAWTDPPPIPPEEVDIGNRFTAHTRRRDHAAINHHYDVSNEFYRQVLGPSMVYSCAVFERATDTLEQAQANKLELVCRKLGLQPGMRLLDVGCGWGSLVLHAAAHYDVTAVGITISESQAALAQERVAEAGLADRIEIRLQDYRDLDDGPYDAVSSIGMFEHVGLAHLSDYFEILRSQLRPGGRLLNHQIGRTPSQVSRWLRREPVAINRKGFIHRYVFPDGELHEVGDVIGAIQRTGFEARHMESIREHYALTLRRWVDNLEVSWDAAVADVGEGRARVWRLYMAASSINFAQGNTQVHQILAVNTPASGADMGRSGMPMRAGWDRHLAAAGAGDPAELGVDPTGDSGDRSASHASDAVDVRDHGQEPAVSDPGSPLSPTGG